MYLCCHYTISESDVSMQNDSEIAVCSVLTEHAPIYAAFAHDLKTPMTSVQGFTEALYDGRSSRRPLR